MNMHSMRNLLFFQHIFKQRPGQFRQLFQTHFYFYLLYIFYTNIKIYLRIKYNDFAYQFITNLFIIRAVFFLYNIFSNEQIMILKNNRFFGRDISNIAPAIRPDQSQDICEKKNRKQSLSLVEQPKACMINNDNKIFQNDIDIAQIDILPNSISLSDKCVPEYFTQIFRYIKLKQISVVGNYCQKTINVDKNSRGEIVNWIIEVHHKFKLFPQTLYFVIYFIDKYLAQRNVQKSKLKLIAISSLYMASKYQETYRVPQMKDLLNLCNYSYTKRDIIQTQADIIKVLNFNLVFDSSFKFLEALQVFSGMNKKNFHLAQYLLQLSLTQSEFLEYNQSLLACSAFYLVCKIRKVEIDWDQKYQSLTNFKQNDLHKCARELCNLLQKIQKINNVSALKKKFSQTEFHEVTRLKLERKK